MAEDVVAIAVLVESRRELPGPRPLAIRRPFPVAFWIFPIFSFVLEASDLESSKAIGRGLEGAITERVSR